MIRPVIPENKAIRIEKRWYSRILEDMFLLAAAGSISSALIMRIPTHFIEDMTMTAMITLKQSSIR
jgi:hypothetical protein